MIQTINEYQFSDAFYKMCRGGQFSYAGSKALYEYLEQYEDDTGEQIELDVIALCCEYAEYKSLEEFQEDYNQDYKSLGDIMDRTQVIMIDDTSFIIQQF